MHVTNSSSYFYIRLLKVIGPLEIDFVNVSPKGNLVNILNKSNKNNNKK